MLRTLSSAGSAKVGGRCHTESPVWDVHIQAAQALEPAALIALLLLKPSGKVAM